MKNAIIKLGVVTLLSVASCFANASFILNGSTTVNELDLTQDVVSFYGRDGNASTTGYELGDSVVFMIGEYLGTSYLVGMFDNGATSGVGNLQLDILDSSSSQGTFILVDDANEAPSGSGPLYEMNFFWGTNYTDGIVYELASGLTDLTLDFVLARGLTDAYFISFDGAGPNYISLSGGLTLVSNSVAPPITAVAEPTKLVLLTLTIMAPLSLRIRRRKNL